MKKINLNEFARKITLMEKGKIEISIAQVKEVLKDTFTELVNNYDAYEIMAMLGRYREK